MVVLRAMLPPASQPRSSTATSVMPWLLGQVVGGGQAVAAAADDDHVVRTLRLGRAPQRLVGGATAADDMSAMLAGVNARRASWTSAQGPWLTVDGRSVLNLCSNNYLGLADGARAQGSRDGGDRSLRGSALGGARSISGTQRCTSARSSAWPSSKLVETAMFLSSGFLANLAVVPGAGRTGDRVYSDELNHASIVDALPPVWAPRSCATRTPMPMRCARCSAEAGRRAERWSSPTACSRWTATWRRSTALRRSCTRPRRCWSSTMRTARASSASHGRGIVDHFGVRERSPPRWARCPRPSAAWRLRVRLGRGDRHAAPRRATVPVLDRPLAG